MKIINFFKRFKLHHYILSLSIIFMIGISVYGANLLSTILNYENNSTAVENPDSFIEQVIAPVTPLKTPINVLLLCGDQSSGNTDTIMVVHFDPVTCQISLISTPRDTASLINNSIYKINYAYPSGGVTRAYQTIGALLGTNIDYYAYINTKVFREIIDILGGVDYYVPVDLNYDDGSQNLHIHLKKGMQHLNGRQAEGLVRYRKPNNMKYTRELLEEGYDGGDLRRVETQQDFIREVIRQKTDVKYITKLNSVLKSIFKNIKTNMSFKTVTRLMYNIKELNVDNMKTYRIAGTTGMYNRLSFFFFNGNLYDTVTKKEVSRQEVLKNEFNAEGLLYKTSYEASVSVLNAIKARLGSGSSTVKPAKTPKITRKPSTPTPKPKPKETPTTPVDVITPEPTVTPDNSVVQTVPPTAAPVKTDPPKTAPPTVAPVKTNPPKTEAPKTEAPKTDAPSTEPPVQELE